MSKIFTSENRLQAFSKEVYDEEISRIIEENINLQTHFFYDITK